MGRMPGGPIRSAQDRLDAPPLARVEWLDDVVVRADLEADDAIDVVAPRGEHHDRCLAHPPQLARDVQTIHAGQHQVEDDEIRSCRSTSSSAAPSRALTTAKPSFSR
jgi:hypothetical protein